ncbi:MAG TPA: hypothetical protein VG123_13130 [Streptosporangiaceae bacterium]|jgi:hypothetical protein|nr:hypothetical protein [Streptosporangiaceae bacterium]
MLNAVWVAVIVAVAFWAAAVCAAVYLMVRAGRLITQTSAAITVLAERQDQLINRANATIDRAGEQLAAAGAITASMDEVTANMAELTGRVASLAPLARVITGTAGSPVAKAMALGYGVTRALWLRLPAAVPPPGGHGGARARLLPGQPGPARGRPALKARRDEAGR